MKKHIYLTGFMGAGKSRIGRHLAERLGWELKDSDKLIETEQGKTVSKIFEEDGEKIFRQLEKEMVTRLAGEKYPALISLGGGAVMNTQIFNIVKNSGLLVYIKSSPETIFERVKHSRKRPLLAVDENDDFEANLLLKIRELLNLRKEIYERSDIIIDRDKMDLETIVDKLYSKFQLFRDNG